MNTPRGSLWQGILPVPGLILSLWALTSLGVAFGIAPAYRGMVTTGPYRRLRHPMYAGEILSLIGACVAAPSLWNLIILLVFIASVLWRIDREEHTLNRNGYSAYATAVRWRLMPGVW
jgi:protein-S-isoprenylcysteine O-methyltransferase Ste14